MAKAKRPNKDSRGWHILSSRRLMNCPAHRPGHSCPWLLGKRCLTRKCHIYFDHIHRFDKNGEWYREPNTGYVPTRIELTPNELRVILGALEAQNKPGVIDLNLNGLIQHFRWRLMECEADRGGIE